MATNFPPLPDVPEHPDDLTFAFDRRTSRPRVWDEYGVPLDSYYGDDYHPVACPADYHPTRHPDDYAHVDPAAGYTPKIVEDSRGYGVNLGLMDYIRPHFPESLHLVLDAAHAYRQAREIPQGTTLNVDEALTVVMGLNSLWAFLMYRRIHRVANGELPVHVANIHRVMVGYEGVLNNTVQSLPKFGHTSRQIVLKPDVLAVMASNGLTNDGSQERCPANPHLIAHGMVALVAPPEEAREKLADTLAQTEQPRLLKDLAVGGITFTTFARSMRQLMETASRESFIDLRNFLQAN